MKEKTVNFYPISEKFKKTYEPINFSIIIFENPDIICTSDGIELPDDEFNYEE